MINWITKQYLKIKNWLFPAAKIETFARTEVRGTLMEYKYPQIDRTIGFA